MKTGIRFSYRCLADTQLKEMLRTIGAGSQADFDEQWMAYMDSDKPLVYIMKEILSIAEAPENSFSMETLRKRFEEYGTSDFSLDELFTEGWLVRCGNEWMHNCRYNRYVNFTCCDSEREKSIVFFLTSLSDIKYMEQYPLHVDVSGEEFLGILDEHSITLEDLMNQGIISNEDEEGAAKNNYYLDSSTDIWRKLGSIVLGGFFRNEISSGHRITDRDYEQWIDICRHMPYVYHVTQYMEDKESVFRYSLKIIEALSSSLQEESNKIRVGVMLATDSRRPLIDIEIPSKVRLRNEFYGMEVDLFHDLDFPSQFSRTICGKAMQICHDLYAEMPEGLRIEFLKVLSDPYFEIHRHYQGYALSAELNVDAVHIDGLRYDALVGIYWALHKVASDRVMPLYDVKQFASRLWDVIYNILPQENEKDAISDVLEFLIYLGENCQFGNEYDAKHRNVSVAGKDETKRVFFKYILSEFVREQIVDLGYDSKVKKYLTSCIEDAENDIEVKLYLMMLISLTRELREFSNVYSVWKDTAKAKVLDVFKRAVNDRFGLTIVPFDLIIEALGADIS